ncbi:MAG: DEAD/DEAH box helicase family protein [Steroidobacteraceae bacterium]
MRTVAGGNLSNLASINTGPGGTALLGQPYREDATVAADYRKSIHELDRFPFWYAGTKAYRPPKGLWAPQRKAVALALAYLSSQRIRRPREADARESALVKMPTGSGKTGVIATLACCAAKVRRTIVLTPRTALVKQMMKDLSWRFWERFGYCYVDSELRRRADVDAARLKKLEVSHGMMSIDELHEKGYLRIWRTRDSERQIIVGTFNALHAVLGPEPPAHRSMQGRQARPPAKVLAQCQERPKDSNGVENFRHLLRGSDLLIVDEGHYEPAFSWAQCVAELDVPTIIFSATPYRNDYKYFNLFGNFAFNLGFDEAVEHHLIRDVRFDEKQIAARATSARPNAASQDLSDFVAFVRARCQTYPLLPEGRPAKCIVHGATYETLKALQCEFYRQDASLRAVLIHDAHTGDESSLNGDLKKLGSRAVAALAPCRFQHVHDASRNQGPGPQSRVWLHQFKLLEGIDNADFHEIFLYAGFRSARELIQQVGRALRYSNPERRTKETASIFGSKRPFDAKAGVDSIATVACRQWNNYRHYERYVASEPARAFTAETQLLSLLKKTAPNWQYIGGEFRKGFFTDDNTTMAEYVVPRRAVVCHYVDPAADPQLKSGGTPLSDSAFDAIARACQQALQLEDRFDIRSVPPPEPSTGYEDVRLIRYLTWANSRNLRQQSIPEWNLGVMVMVRVRPFVFVLDTDGVCIDFERLGFFSASPEEMKRLFSDPVARKDRIRIVEATTAGLDLSEGGIRSMTIRKRNLSDGYFDLAEASQAPSSLHGVAVLDERTTRRELSIRRGRLADPTTRYIGLKDYVRWTRSLAKNLGDKSIMPHHFFTRFAQEVGPPDKVNGEAQNLLLDIWGLLNADDAAFANRAWDANVARELLEYDMCLEAENVAEDKDEPEWVFVLGGKYQVRVKYTRRNTIPPKGRYSLHCPALDDALVTPQTATPGTLERSPFGGGPTEHGASLMALINQEQCFRVLPAEEDVVYANGVFFKPSIDWDALRTGADGNLLEPIVISASLNAAVSEKGESGVTAVNWATRSQFGIIVSAFHDPSETTQDPMRSEIATSDLLVCDDGSAEIGDFVSLHPSSKKIILIHAKAKFNDGGTGVSASKLETVGRQASASLAFVGSTRASLPFPTHWAKKLTIRNRKTKKTVKILERVHARTRTSAKQAHQRIGAALKDPTYRREVWVVTTGIVSKKEAQEMLGGDERKRGALQFAYYLADLRTTFGRAGVTLKIFSAE